MNAIFTFREVTILNHNGIEQQRIIDHDVYAPVLQTLPFKLLFVYGSIILSNHLRRRNRKTTLSNTQRFVFILIPILVFVAIALSGEFLFRAVTQFFLPKFLVLSYIFLGLTIIAYMVGIDWLRTEKERQQLQELNLKNELLLLKSQINPHFLFNTLNNIFSFAQEKGNDDVAEGIRRLSELLRYSVYNAEHDEVPLQREVHLIADYLELAKLRYAPDDVTIEFDYSTISPIQHIAPMLLLPFVENALKYGVQENGNTTLHISLTSTEKEVQFYCRNQIVHRRQALDDGGIGLTNISKRLALLYPNRHTLTIEEDMHYFQVHLRITLL